MQNIQTFNQVTPEAFFQNEPHQVVETHLSYVVLTSKYVFKFKKTIHFEFVDYSTSEKRWNACIQELVLNRRLSKNVYLGIALFRANHESALSAAVSYIDPTQETLPKGLEPAVVMRRLSDDFRLTSFIANDTIRLDDHLIFLSKLLAKFHQNVIVCPPGYSDTVKGQILENVATVNEVVKTIRVAHLNKPLKRINTFIKNFLETEWHLVTDRVYSGGVVDGHGDLRAEHVYFENTGSYTIPTIQIIDCVEFNRQLRECDRAAEIGFLSMDFDYLKRGDCARHIEESYIKASQDNKLSSLLPFFKSYRALVRAKVTLLRLGQCKSASLEYEVAKANAVGHIELACRYALGLTQPFILVIGGLTGTGKSTLAEALSYYLYCNVYSSDKIRKSLFSEDEATYKDAPYETGLYTSDITEHTYDALFEAATKDLSRGNPVIVDASFLKRSHREKLIEFVEKFQCPYLFIECSSPEKITKERLAERTRRGSISDGRWEIYLEQKKRLEPIAQEENLKVLRVDTEKNPEDVSEEVVQFLLEISSSTRSM